MRKDQSRLVYPSVSAQQLLTTRHLQWLQSRQQAELFDNLFVRRNPSYLTQLSPIVALSVGVAVTSSMQTNVADRLAWLDVVLGSVDLRVRATESGVYQRLTFLQEPELGEIAPRIMEVLTQRLETLYMTMAGNNPHDPILRRIPPLSRRARELVQ